MHEEEEWTFTYYIRTRVYKLACIHTYSYVHTRVYRGETYFHTYSYWEFDSRYIRMVLGVVRPEVSSIFACNTEAVRYGKRT